MFSMISVAAKPIFMRALAFAGTALFSLAIMNSLPRIKQQRQRHFAQATMDGNVRRMRWLHFAGAKINAQTNLGSPLFVAAGEGNVPAVRYLLDEGADANAREKSGNTPLAEAAYYGHVAVVKELLLRGADINAISEHGTALDISVTRNNTAVADLLKHHGGKSAREIRAGG
jgi:ankyrin repeat protein